MSKESSVRRSRRESLRLATTGTVAAVLGSLIAAPQEALAAGQELKIKQGRVTKVALSLARVGTKGKNTVVVTVDLTKVAQQLQKVGTYELKVHAGIVAPDMTEAIQPIAERTVIVE